MSRYADDPGVQALALSLVPAELAAVIGDRGDHSLPAVTMCVSPASWLVDVVCGG